MNHYRTIAYAVVYRGEALGTAKTAAEAKAILDRAGVPPEIAGSERYGVELLHTEHGTEWRPKFRMVL